MTLNRNGTEPSSPPLSRNSNRFSIFSLTLSQTPQSSVTLSIPPIYKQIRVYVYLFTLVIGIIAASLMIHLFIKYSATSTTSLSIMESISFFFFVAASHTILLIAGIMVYIFAGHLLFSAVDAPFIICGDLPGADSVVVVKGSANQTLSRNFQKDKNVYSMSSGLRPYESPSKSDNQSFSSIPSNQSANSKPPSPWVPIMDMSLHTLVFFFWIGTLADFGLRHSSCAKNVNDNSNACDELGAIVGLGTIAAFGVLVCVAMKVKDFVRMDMYRAIVKRGY